MTTSDPGVPVPVPQGTTAFLGTAAAGRAAEPAQPPSLIETMRIEPGGDIPLLRGHMARLEASCRALGHAWPGSTELELHVNQRVAGLDGARAWRLRLLLAPDGRMDMETAPLESLPSPLRIALAGPRVKGAERWLRHKTTHRPWYQDAAAWLARRPDIFDLLYWNESGHVCEGSRSNLYIRTSDGRWLTPPIESGALPGVQRQALLESGQVEVATITLEQFLQAPAWRISNALRGWRDVILATD